jgi:predicted permease
MGTQFRTLFRHFFERFFDTDSVADSDGRIRIIQLLAMLSVPGLMLSFFMKSDHPPGLTLFVTPAFSEIERIWLRVGDRYIFISYAMIAMGLLMAFKWDSLFPDRRDYLALTPLPISMRRWFAAKVLALCAFLALFVAAINAFSLLIVPTLIAEQAHAHSLPALFRAFLAHAAGTLGGSLFAALFFVSLQGLLINVLSAQAFRRISPYVQMVSISVLVTLLLITPLIKESIPRLAQSPSRLLDYLPFMWFLGLYEFLIPGGSVVPQSAVWARTAAESLTLTAIVFVISYLAGYRRYSRKILEDVQTESFSARWWTVLTERILDRTVLRDPVERGTFHFIGKIAARSSRHRILTALYVGIATGLALTSSHELEASLAVLFVVSAGLRATFNVPYELNANWLFQMTDGAERQLAAVRKWVLLYRIFPILVGFAILESFRFDPAVVIRHVAFDAVVAVFLVEAFFFKFNKVPFTCSFASDKVHVIVLAAAYLFGFTTFVDIAGALKRAVTAGSPTLIAFILLSAAIFELIRRRRTTTAVIYKEAESGPLSLSVDGGYWKPAVSNTWRRREPWNAKVAISSFCQDFKFGVRILRKSAGLSACAAILLALVIGGNATIYSFVHSFITLPAPGVRGDGLAVVGLAGRPGVFFPITDYMEYAEQSRTLRPLLGFTSQRFVMTLPQGSYALTGAAVTPNYFETLGVPIAKGRPFTEDENRLESSGLVAVISDRVWKEEFDSSPDIIGFQATLNGQPTTIIGVSPPNFQGAILASTEDLWVPLLGYSFLNAKSRQPNNLPVELATLLLIGRLAPHVSLGRAQAEFATLTARLAATRPPDAPKRTIELYPYSATVTGDARRMREFFAIFSVVTALTLLIVCANVANLMLGRAAARQRETAVRQSMGATRSRILTMLVAESLSISLVAWVIACVFTVWLTHAVRWLLPHDFTNPLGIRRDLSILDFKADWVVLLYAMALAVIGTLVFSILPVIHAWRQEVLAGLRTGEQASGQGRSWVANLLVVVQFAFSVLLLTTAGLAYHSLSLIQVFDVGFNKENLLLVSINPTLNAPKRDANLALLERVRESLGGTAGIRSVSYVRYPAPLTLPPRDVGGLGADHREQASVNYVGPGYLDTLALTPVAGRDISAGDHLRTNKVAIINQNLAESLFPGRSAIGQTIALGKPEELFEVVGVAPNAFLSGAQNDTRPKFVLLAEQQDERRVIGSMGFRDLGEMTFYVRYTGSFDAAVATFGRTMRDVDDKTGIIYVRTMNTQLDTNGPQRVLTRLLVLFAAVCLMIAAIGQYAVVTFSMRRRVREFGVRIAVGASAGNILRLVLREGLLLTLAGLVAGSLLSFGVAVVLQGVLFGVTPSDPLTYIAVILLLAAASLLACYLPARRASRVDPLAALRYE